MGKYWKYIYVLFFIFLFFNLITDSPDKKVERKQNEIKFSDFVDKAKKGELESIVIKGDIVEGTLKSSKDNNDKNSDENGEKSESKKFTSKVIFYPRLLDILEEKAIPTEIKIDEVSGITFTKIIDIFVSLLWIVMIIFIFRSLKSDKFSIGKTNIKMFTSDMQKVRFSDVLGADEAKQEVAEIVDFLSDPTKYSRLGAKIPKGVLLVGAPGTGKTLLAKAIAGEAGVPFFSTSGSEFVEMFVGVGASRVRALFEQAKKSAPCLVFIDEIDAVGRHRGSGYGGGNDEREQTLNQLLVEMDGFETNAGIIIIAATNRVDVLDDALLRPGRFDRQVYIDLPDLKGREAILKKYINEVDILSDVDIASVARGTPGFSGAELANLVNEAAIIAARKNKKKISQDDFEYARDKILMGLEHKSRTMSPAELKNTAYHEAGHALCSVLLPEVDPIHKATIVPRGQALGLVQQLPERDKVSVNITEIRSNIAVALAGRISEETFFGKDKITTGASSDIQAATKYARNSVVFWGLSPKVGTVYYGEREKYPISEETSREIDLEVKRMIDEGYKLAKSTISKHKTTLEKLAKALLEYETLTGDEVRAIVKGKKIKLTKKIDVAKNRIERISTLPLTTKKKIKQEEKKK
ncbi:ATP-dependent zinc metalloprotease FtsH [bacterium]|nr:ATP-dependent zinc metalloprotease FtsH [bacterium]